jgi:hypothetical protein
MADQGGEVIRDSLLIVRPDLNRTSCLLQSSRFMPPIISARCIGTPKNCGRFKP